MFYVGKATALAENLNQFQDLNLATANGLIDAGQEHALLKHLDKFIDLDYEKIANKIIARGRSDVVAHNLDKFQYLNSGAVFKLADTEYGATKIRNNLHRFHEFSEADLATLSAKFGEAIREFPAGDNRKAQHEWYADFAYQDMGDGWRKAAIGQVIGLRLDQVTGENDLHDASQWLSEFKVPAKGYDASRIEALVAGDPDLSPEELLAKAEVSYQDPELEQNLLKQIYQAAPELRVRLNLPTKDQKLDTLFTDHASRYVYSLLARNLGNAELFDPASGSLLEMAEKSFDEYYSKFITERRGKGQQTVGQTPKDELWQSIQKHLARIDQEVPEDAGAITESISQLLKTGRNRQTYIDDTQSWLLRHATAPRAKLVKAWGDRPMALANGTKDSLSAVLLWQQENAFRLTVDSIAEDMLPKGITKDELLSDRWQSWRSELGRVQSVNNSIEAIGKAKHWLAKAEGRPKVMPASSIEIKENEADAKSYRFEVLAGDDPRGFTIGEDTGCCMTINGISENCIKAGYQNPNAGFMALYTPDNRLTAQSFMYVNPENPDVLVLDNIEANEGRDFAKITELYKKAWQQYLEEHPELAIKNVHVGEGYTDVSLRHLPKIDAVPPLNNNIYTDAERQRKLI